jgi:hypothetical protein
MAPPYALEQYCLGCEKIHQSSVWYFKIRPMDSTRDWLCGLKYLVLPAAAMDTWTIFPYV